MRKTALILLGTVGLILFYFTFVTAIKAFRSDWLVPPAPGTEETLYRFVLITQELETPFWVKVGSGAMEEAKQSGASLEIWGSYSKNPEEFLKKVEIAIDSKVDGIIVQGLDTDDFKNLTKLKAGFYGIPIITVANDVPMEQSLRKTYVGSDQFAAGQLIASELVSDMGNEGTVIVIGDSRREYYEQQRINGIYETLQNYSGIRTQFAETPDAREQIIATTRDMMNLHPDVKAFIAVNANIAGTMIQEIGKRSQVEPFHIYSFDDSPDTRTLLMQGKLDGMIEQSPEEMGRLSVQLMAEWLRGDKVPLDPDGYLTGIRMLKAGETP